MHPHTIRAQVEGRGVLGIGLRRARVEHVQAVRLMPAGKILDACRAGAARRGDSVQLTDRGR